MKTIAMKCASCGAGLQISPEMDHVACGYCGTSLSIVRQGGTVALKLVVDSIAKVQVGTDRTAAELALLRLPKEIKAQQRELNEMEERIRYLVAEIKDASLRGRRVPLIVRHALRAIMFGGARGLLIGFIINWFFQAWLPNDVGVFVGLVVAMSLAVENFRDPLKVSERLSDKIRRQFAPFNAGELQRLRHASAVLERHLQKLNGQMAAARAIVNS